MLFLTTLSRPLTAPPDARPSDEGMNPSSSPVLMLAAPPEALPKLMLSYSWIRFFVASALTTEAKCPFFPFTLNFVRSDRIGGNVNLCGFGISFAATGAVPTGP